MIESKVSDTILEKVKHVEVAGVTYEVAPVTTATLIEVSKLVRCLPHLDIDAENPMFEAIAKAEDCHQLGKVAATLMLGVKNQTKIEKHYFFNLVKIKVKPSLRRLTNDLLNLTPSKLKDIIFSQLNTMEVSDFFLITTSLSEINMMRKTTEVVS